MTGASCGVWSLSWLATRCPRPSFLPAEQCAGLPASAIMATAHAIRRANNRIKLAVWQFNHSHIGHSPNFICINKHPSGMAGPLIGTAEHRWATLQIDPLCYMMSSACVSLYDDMCPRGHKPGTPREWGMSLGRWPTFDESSNAMCPVCAADRPKLRQLVAAGEVWVTAGTIIPFVPLEGCIIPGDIVRLIARWLAALATPLVAVV